MPRRAVARMLAIGMTICAATMSVSLHAQSKPDRVVDTITVSKNTIIQELESFSDGRYSVLLDVLAAAGLYDELNDDTRQVTLFAPSNAAFDAVDENQLLALLSNPEQLRNLLRYHIVPFRLSAEDACQAAADNGGSYTVQTEAGSDVSLSCNGSTLFVNGNSVSGQQLFVSSNLAIIHQLSGVLFAGGGGAGVPNKAPVALDDTFGPLTAGTAGRLAVLANDEDVDGSLDVSSVMILEQPVHGTLVVEADGHVVYTHNGNSGTKTDSFTYTVKDNEGAESNVATVTIHPIEDVETAPGGGGNPAPGGGDNIAPVAVDDVYNLPQGGSTGQNVLLNDSDSDGSLVPGTLTIVSGPANGTARITGTEILYVNDGSGATTDSLTYTVQDDDGATSNVATVFYNLIPAAAENHPPVAVDDNFGPFRQGSTAELAVLANDSDSDGSIVLITIVQQPSNGMASVVNGQIVYINDGSGATRDTLAYVVQDDDGANSERAHVTIELLEAVAPQNIAPVAVDDSYNLEQGGSTGQNVLRNDRDSDGTLVPGSLTIVRGPNNGTARITGTEILYQHDGGSATSDSLTYTVQDDDGATSNVATVFYNITPSAPQNQAPVAANDSFGPIDQGATANLQVLGNDRDPDGSIVLITIVRQPANGTATVSGDRIVYTNNGSGATSDSLVYTVQDDDGATSNQATVTISVNAPAPQNIPPVAVNDTYNLEQGGSTGQNVLRNDSDPDGSLVPGTLTIVSQPSNGTARISAGEILYVNDGSGALTDSLTYTVQDDDGATSNIATVFYNLTAGNRPPLAANDNFGPFDQGSNTGPLNVLANDSDSDGTLQPGTVTITRQPGNGTATVSGGQIIYINDGSGALSDSLTYTVQDDDGASSNEATVTFTLNRPAPSNRPPVAANDFYGPFDQGANTGPLDVLANDGDSDGTVDPNSIQIVRQPVNGTATVSNGTITYINNGSGPLTDSLTYTVRDDDGATSNTATVIITLRQPAPENQAPVAVNDSYGPFEQGANTGPLAVLGNDSDPDGSLQPGTLVIVRQPGNGTASVSGGQIIYINDGSGATTDSLTYTVQDDDGATSNVATVTFTLREPAPENQPPVAVNDSYGPFEQGANTGPLAVLGNDSDADGTLQPGTLVIVRQPGNGTASVSGGQIVYINDGNGARTDSLTYTVRDDDGAVSNVATVTFTLNESAPSNRPPVAGNDFYGPFDQGANTGPLDVLANDNDSDGTIDPATIEIIRQTRNGTASVVDGRIVYVNDGNGSLTDSLTYTVRDDDGATSNIATVIFTLREPAPENQAPVAVNDNYGPFEQGANTGPLAVLDNDRDPDGTLVAGTLRIVSQPGNGTATVSGGRIIYVNDGSGATRDSLTYTVQDDDGATSNVATVSFHLEERAQPPVTVLDSFTIDQGESAALDVLANDSDPDGNLVPSTLTIITSPTNGAAQVLDGRIIYTHNGDGSISDLIVYSIEDDDGLSAQGLVNISINRAPQNNAPVARDDAYGPFNQGATTTALNVLANDSDSDGSLVPGTVTIVRGPNNGTATVSGGRIVYVNDGSGATSDSLTYTVQDDDGATSNIATVTFTLNEPANIRPVANNDIRGPLDTGASITIDVLDNDDDTDGTLDPSTVTIVRAPFNGTVTVQADGTVLYQHDGNTGTGSDSFTYFVKDNDGASSNISSVTISPIVDAVAPNLVQLLESDGNYTTLLRLLRLTGLDITLADENRRFTVFAPSDAVFNALGSATLNRLLADLQGTRELLLYHVISRRALNADALCTFSGRQIETFIGQTVSINCAGDEVFVNASKVVVADRVASNGIFHGISPILERPVVAPQLNLYETIRGNAQYSTLTSLLESAGLAGVLSNLNSEFTLFAPTNAAFAALDAAVLRELRDHPESLRKVLEYHVIAGRALAAANLLGRDGQTIVTVNGTTVSVSVSAGKLFINGSAVVLADIFASNGVAHGINGVLIPSNISLGGSTILELIKNDGRFSKLELALRETGLAHELANSSGEYTVFLPTNDAFHRLGSVKLHWLFKNKSHLKTVLKNHIVSHQTLDLATLRSKGRVTNANNRHLSITQSSGRTYVNNSRVQQGDKKAKNGIAHVIDKVLL